MKEIKINLTNKKFPVSGGVYGLDLETTGLDPHTSEIRLVQIYSPVENVSFVYDMFTIDEVTKKKLCEFIAHHSFYIHNALFDVQFIQEKFDIPFVHCFCTMIMYSTVLRVKVPDSKKYSLSLKGCMSQLFHEDISKYEQRSDWSASELSDEQLKYAAHDAYYTWLIGSCLFEKAARVFETNNFRITTEAINAVARLSRNGIYIDVSSLDKLISQWSSFVETAERDCERIYKDLNIRSSVQLGAWLRGHLTPERLELWPKTEKGSLKTDTVTLEEFSSDIPELKPLLTYKKYQKYLSTYGDSIKKLINPVTGRLHPQYTLAFTETGRMSSMNPNIQNFPRAGKEGAEGNYRSLFVPQKGEKESIFVCADYSQVEVRVAAILSHDERMIETYKNGQDLYKITASLLLNKSVEDVTSAERQRAKAVVLGLQFGMGAKKLCVYAKNTFGVIMTEEESAEMVRNYTKAFPELYAWQRRTTEDSMRSMYATTVGGLVRKLSQDNYYTCSLNTPVQGSAAEVLLLSLTKLDKDFITNHVPAKIVATVHDEILVECEKSKAEEVKDYLEKAMTWGFTQVFPDNYGVVNNIVEAHIGESWYDAK